MGDMGLVEKGVVWKLNRAVYGLRQSPTWWSDERDAKLRKLMWTSGGDHVYLEQHEVDSQVWSIRRRGNPCELLGLLCVYVDDFLLLAEDGPAREASVQALTTVWEFGAERVLTPDVSLGFLGLDFYQRSNGDIYLSQKRLTKGLLQKWGGLVQVDQGHSHG